MRDTTTKRFVNGTYGRELALNILPQNSNSGSKVALGAIASGAVNVIKVVLQLLLLPLMARLLGPDEFGLYALALPTVSLISLLADGGLGATLAREEETSSLVWSSAFWALLFTGAILTLGSTIFGVLLGYLAHQPRLAPMIALLSLSLVFLTLSVVPSARLARRKHLGIGAGADLVSNIVGAIVAVVMAWHGAGAWSLAVQYLLIYAVRGTLINLAAFHFPAVEFSFKALRPHLVTGGVLVASRISEYAGRATENFLTDKIFGIVVLGNYTFANQISKFAGDAAGNVVWAALYVQALTGNRDNIALLHRKLCRLLGVIFFPAVSLAVAAAPELINLLLGPKWSGLSLFLRIFLPLYFFSVVCSQSAPILLAYGRYEIQFWCMVGLSTGRIVSVVLGLWVGLTGTVCGIAVTMFLFCVAMLIFPAKATGCQPLPMLAGLIRPALSSVAAAVVYLMILTESSSSTNWTLATGLTGGLLAYALCMVLIDRKNLVEDLTMVRGIVMPKRYQ
jgi:O-antigen/teichoic acid export membrane protein